MPSASPSDERRLNSPFLQWPLSVQAFVAALTGCRRWQCERDIPVRDYKLLGSEQRLPDLRQRHPHTSAAGRGVLSHDLLGVSSDRTLLLGENRKTNSNLKEIQRVVGPVGFEPKVKLSPGEIIGST